MSLLEQKERQRQTLFPFPAPLSFVARPPEKTISENGRNNAPVSEDGLRVSCETYWEKYYHHPDFNYEWVNGRLEEIPMSNVATFNAYRWLLKLLEIYLEANKIATLTGLEMGFTVPLPPELEKKRNKKRENVRKPDLGVVLNSNPVNLDLQDNSYSGIFDLCVEALSYTNKKAEKRDTVDKKEEYQHVRVKEYYILDDREKETAFLRIAKSGIYSEIEPIDGDIIRSEVLPGFQFRISDLYRQPLLSELVKDKVYQGFVMLKYQAEKEEKEKAQRLAYSEQERADQAEAEKEKAQRLAYSEKERADRAEKEKERLRALLLKMGIKPD